MLGDRQGLRGRAAARARPTRSRRCPSGPRTPSAISASAARSRARRWSPGAALVTRYVPRGLVGVIGPWNYPLLNSFGDAIPALAAGNSVLLKPSELTPLTSLLVAAGRWRECGLPDGVFDGRDRRARDRRGAGRARRLRDVHGLDRDRPRGRRARRRGARRRAPSSWAARTRWSCSTARRSSAPPTSPSTTGCSTPARAASRSSASTSQASIYDEFLAKLDREGRGAARRAARRPGLGRRRRDHLAARSWRSSRPTSPTRSSAARASRSAARACRAPGASSSRRCWSASTTRCAACARRPSARRCR